jgi:hypothetical protein
MVTAIYLGKRLSLAASCPAYELVVGRIDETRRGVE